MPSILIVDDEPGVRSALGGVLRDEGYDVDAVDSGEACLERLGRQGYDVVVLDIWLPGMDGLATLTRMRERQIDTQVVIISGHGNIESAVRAIKMGAFDFVEKPLSLEKTVLVVRNALRQRTLEVENRALRARVDAQHLMIGESYAMVKLREQVAMAAPTNGRVLIFGENGTGKELVARNIHQLSRRRTATFVEVNCAAIPEELIESELFGHERGAFTGATNRTTGSFEQAAGGTLFLDEIGDMPPEAQTRLLRVLQEGEFMSVGGRRPIKADVRIIAATHRDLRLAIQQNQFREDLFYRLNVVPIRLPPLRERVEDIPLLARHFLDHAAAHGMAVKALDATAIDRLKAYRWPGNVRELENLMRRLAALYPQETITEAVLDAELADAVAAEPAAQASSAGEPLMVAVERHIRQFLAAHVDGPGPTNVYDRVMAEVERPLIRMTLAATRGNQIRAAAILGLNRNTLRKKIRDLAIPVVRGLE